MAIFEKIAQSVAIVTAKSDGKVNGLSIAWLCQVSYSPPMIVVSVAPGRHSYGMIKKSKAFVVNILGEGQEDMGRHFGTKSGRKADKLEGFSYKESKTGAPILDDGIAYYECKLVSTHKAGDHELFVGEVVNYDESTKKEPLVFVPGDYF